MKKILVVAFLISSKIFGNDLFLDQIKDEKLLLGFNNGEIHEITFNQNRLGIITGSYRDELGKEVNNMVVSFEVFKGQEYMRLYKDRVSPIGTYKYEMFVFIPTDFESGKTTVHVDARWGRFKQPLIFVE